MLMNVSARKIIAQNMLSAPTFWVHFHVNVMMVSREMDLNVKVNLLLFGR